MKALFKHIKNCAAHAYADKGFEHFRKPTRRDPFLAEMDAIIPWRDLCKVIKPFYLGDELFSLINTYLQEKGLKVSTGTIVDATIIAAPSSTKNKDGTRDPEMHQTRKENQWYFGMKAPVASTAKAS